MADGPDRAQRSGATPGKLILIAVLAVVLAAVLYIQFGRSGSADVPAARKPTAARRAQGGRASAAATREQEQPTKTLDDAPREPDDDAAWKPPDLATVIAYDPFAVPASFPQPRRANDDVGSFQDGETAANQGIDAMVRDLEQTRKQLEDMRQLGVKVILEQHGQYVALIGDQMIHVGDEINGFTVTAITPSGVRVERKIKE